MTPQKSDPVRIVPKGYGSAVFVIHPKCTFCNRLRAVCDADVYGCGSTPAGAVRRDREPLL